MKGSKSRDGEARVRLDSDNENLRIMARPKGVKSWRLVWSGPYEGQPDISSVQKFSPSGTLLERWALPDPAEAIATDTAGHVYTLSSETHSIDVSDDHGRPLGSWTNPHFGVGQTQQFSLAVGPTGVVYVTDLVDDAILEYNAPAFVERLSAAGLAATPALSATTVTVTAENGAGAPAPTYMGTVHFTSSDPFAELPPDTTFTPIDSGTRSFVVRFNTSGPQTVTVTDTADPTLAATYATTVYAPPPGSDVQVPPGGSVSSAPPGATPNPLIVGVESPQGGTVGIDATVGTTGLPVGYSALGFGAVIVAPAGTVNSPLQLTFELPTSALPSGVPASGVTVFRNGIPIADCATQPSTIAAPDPCVASRTVVGPVLTLVVLTTHASTWGFATGHGVVVDNAATATAPAERINHPTAG